MPKKIFGLAVILTGVLIFAGAGCANKNFDEQKAGEGAANTEGAVNEINVPAASTAKESAAEEPTIKNTMLAQCAQAPSQEAKDNCYANVALQSRDVSFCGQISDAIKANQCSIYINALNNPPKK